MKQHELSIEDRLERAYTACKIPIEDVMEGIKQAINNYLESQGFIVKLVKRKGTPEEKTLNYFFLDKMLSYEQIRNRIIRNKCEASRYIESRKSQVQIDMEIANFYNIQYATIERIRWRER